MSASENLVTFPAGVLGENPARLPLLARGDGWIALAKPSGFGVATEPVDGGSIGLVEAMIAAIDAGKGQMKRLGLDHVSRVHGLDPMTTGAVVLAVSEESSARLRNELGSGRFQFLYDVVASAPAGVRVIECDLPLARNKVGDRIYVSHTGGRKCRTTFSLAETYGHWALWTARTSEARPHQIRIHAAESGLAVPGETRYGQTRLIHLSAIKRNYRHGKSPEGPLHGPLCLHLREIHLPLAGGEVARVVAPRPRSFDALLKRLAEAAAGGISRGADRNSQF